MQKIMPVELLFSGIIDERNELMTDEAVRQIIKNDEKKCLMRVGLAHVDGIIEEFKKYGEVRVEEIKIDVK